jgi:Holliday junction resolvase RusA-like endonuclease
MEMTYIIPSEPAEMARVRVDGNYNSDAQKMIRLVTTITLQSQHKEQPKFSGPVIIIAHFYLHPTFKRFRHMGHLKRPTLASLLKSIEDLSQEIIFTKNAHIVSVTATISHDHNPRTELFVQDMPRNFQ